MNILCFWAFFFFFLLFPLKNLKLLHYILLLELTFLQTALYKCSTWQEWSGHIKDKFSQKLKFSHHLLALELTGSHRLKNNFWSFSVKQPTLFYPPMSPDNNSAVFATSGEKKKTVWLLDFTLSCGAAEKGVKWTLSSDNSVLPKRPLPAFTEV